VFSNILAGFGIDTLYIMLLCRAEPLLPFLIRAPWLRRN